jgi:hypothetical protein
MKPSTAAAHDQRKPGLPKISIPLQRPTNRVFTKPSKHAGSKKLRSAQNPMSSDKARRENDSPKPPKPAEKLPISQEPEADGGVKIEVADIATESIERDEGPSGLLENTPISIEERSKEEQREVAAKEPPQASGSTGTSYIQRGKDAASGFAEFTTKASKLHSQLPGSIKEDAESRLQTGRQCITTTVQPAADGAKGKVEEITQRTSNIPTNLSSLSGHIVGDDGMILDDTGNYIGRLVESCWSNCRQRWRDSR